MFPDLLQTAIAVLDASDSEPVLYRVFTPPSGYSLGQPVGGSWGPWTTYPAPVVVDHLATATRSQPPADDGDRKLGAVVLYGGPVAELAAMAGEPPGLRVEIRVAGMDYAVQEVSEWRQRAGFVRARCEAVDRRDPTAPAVVPFP